MTEDFFTHPPAVAPDPARHVFRLEALAHVHRSPGEFVRVLRGSEYGFDGVSILVSETMPGGGPTLHVHEVEEAHILLEGSAEYLIGEERLHVEAPYVARIPPGVPHTFINAGVTPFRLVAVLMSKSPSSETLAPNPLMSG